MSRNRERKTPEAQRVKVCTKKSQRKKEKESNHRWEKEREIMNDQRVLAGRGRDDKSRVLAKLPQESVIRRFRGGSGGERKTARHHLIHEIGTST